VYAGVNVAVAVGVGKSCAVGIQAELSRKTMIRTRYVRFIIW
jgi:hypothetical protein